MCPDICPNLTETYGDEFEELYQSYEAQGKYIKQIKARELFHAILDSQIETGTPYMLYKDACNKKSNQKNLGTIHSSNLCTEIIEYTSPDEIAVCNLASIALPKYIKIDDNGIKSFNFQKLYQVTKVITYNLNKIIDINYYPVIEAKNSNLRHRPIGIGIQGLADTFALLSLAFESKEAQQLNQDIFETIYYAALTASNELSQKYGPYQSYPGSPISKGIFQFNLWGNSINNLSGKWDWLTLKQSILQYGVRNSLLLAPMPTASTSQILGNNECFEPYSSNIYTRRTLAGEFVVVNKHLMKELIEIKLWSEKMKQKLIAYNGSIQKIKEIPLEIRNRYKTVWEIKGKILIDMAAARGQFIDQSQSLNVHMANVNYAKLTSLHFYAWSKGLKTGMYYLRTKSAVDADKVTISQQILREQQQVDQNTTTTVTEKSLKKKKKKKEYSPSVDDDDLTSEIDDEKMETLSDLDISNLTSKFANGEITESEISSPEKKPSNIEEWRKQRKNNKLK